MMIDQEKLEDFINSRRDIPFEWGRTDCCLFVADWILENKGKDPASQMRGKYSTAFGAARQLLPYGGILECVRSCALLREIPPLHASRGDILCARFDGKETLGICLGRISAFVGLHGLEFPPTRDISQAWRIL